MKPERRELHEFGRLGTMDQFQFVRLGLGAMMALFAFAFTLLTVGTIRDLVAGRPIDHEIARTVVALLAVYCAALAFRLIVRTALQVRLTRTGKRVRGTMVAVEMRDYGRWRNSYRFHDQQGTPREGRFETRIREYEVGDEGDVYYADGWAGSRWMSESNRKRKLPPQPPPPSAAKGIAQLGGFIAAASLLVATGVLLVLAFNGLAAHIIEGNGLWLGGTMLVGLWVFITAFAVPFVAVLALCLGPFVAAAYLILKEAFGD